MYRWNDFKKPRSDLPARDLMAYKDHINKLDLDDKEKNRLIGIWWRYIKRHDSLPHSKTL